jgi:hypothetical protein
MVNMTEPRFRVGQLVTVARSTLSTAAGQYEVVRLMPLEGQTVRYRIKCHHEAHERIVAEHELIR